MKCAVAIVLALFGLAVANPVGHVSLTSPAVSVTSSIINHGITLPAAPIIPQVIVVPKVIHAPIITSPVYTSWGHGWSGHGWDKSW